VTIADLGPSHDLAVTIDTDPGLVPADLAGLLASALETLLLRGFEDPNCTLAALPIMTSAMRAEVMRLAAGTTVPLPHHTTVATLCSAQAEQMPDAVALCYGEEEWSYAKLHRRAARLARRLVAAGVGPGVIVGIALPREAGLVVAVLAVHKAGGAYLALDPTYPAERIRFIIDDAAAPIIITDNALASIFADSRARLLFETETTGEDQEIKPLVAAGPSDLTYVLYTSGSTGRPKVVGIEHGNLINLILWGRSIVSDSEIHGVLFSTSLNFDLSAFEMFVPLAFGGRAVLVENLLTLQFAPQRDKVRLVNAGPSLLEALLTNDGLPVGVTTVILAGERLSRRLATSLFEHSPGVRLLNCYGPTETTVYSGKAQIPADSSTPTIGRPIWDTTFRVLGRRTRLATTRRRGRAVYRRRGSGEGLYPSPGINSRMFPARPICPGTNLSHRRSRSMAVGRRT
jgi:non-ribosomal peptide synthetase component F